MHWLSSAYSSRDWQTVTEGSVRFALLGLGWWTIEEVLPALAESEFCEATVVVSGSDSKARNVAASVETVEHGLTYDAFHEGAAADAYDAVYVCTPNAYHLPYVETAADRGKAVLCEKPMEATVERAERMVAACVEAGTELMVGYRMQTDPLVRFARRLLRDGFIGEPVHVLGNNSQTLLDMIPDPEQWRLDPDVTGYGTSVMDLGVYPLNTTRFLLDADPVRVQALMASESEAFEDVPDERSVFTVELDDGTIMTATSSQHAHASTNLRIIGTDGELVLEPAFHMETALRVRCGDEEVTLTPDQANQMTELFDFFADRLLGGSAIGPDGEHGLVDMATLQAIYEANETGTTIVIDG